MNVIDYIKEIGGKAMDLMTNPNFLIIATIFSLLVSIIGLLPVIAKWKLYQKAGYPGWAIFIPYYSDFAYIRIAGLPWWCYPVKLLITYLLPTSNAVIKLLLNVLVSKAYGRDIPFGLGLTFLPVVFFPVLGFGKNDYLHPKLLEFKMEPKLPELPKGDT